MKVTGTDLRVMRMHAKKTTMQMAEIAGVKTRKTYENWEKGSCTPNINQFIVMTMACGFDVVKVLRQVKQRETEDTVLDVYKALK
ncbi:MAG: XRE family transcriptional regulator [Alteromonadaceae bacterium]|nr:XRE family transcriptional regulator [Alteromonadaceae bacterium]